MSMDPHTLERFAIALGIAKNSGIDGGRREARQLATNIASQAGLSFDAAFALLDEEDRVALACVPSRVTSIAADDDDEPASVAEPEADEDEDEDVDDEPALPLAAQMLSSGDDAAEGAAAQTSLSTTAEIERVAAVKAALAADPDRSDRDVAREIGCSPTTVGRARAAAGLQRVVRTVRRGCTSFDMAIGRRGSPIDGMD